MYSFFYTEEYLNFSFLFCHLSAKTELFTPIALHNEHTQSSTKFQIDLHAISNFSFSVFD